MWATARSTNVAVCVTILLTMTATALAAQTPADDNGAAVVAGGRDVVLTASRVASPPVIDGILDDAVWISAEAAGRFVQRQPAPGEPSAQRTEARIAYDDVAVYVAVRAYDAAPDRIASQLSRRDATGIFSDWVDVIIDSFHDRRTAYRFSVNPHGVKKDVFHYNDGQEDISWDAIWDVATAIDEHGWTAEFRIPLSQIRYAEGSGEQTWGVQFGRTIARSEETSFWAPVLPNAGGFISLAGTLRGISGLASPKRVELLPYAVSKVTMAPEPATAVPNPFWQAREPGMTMGADVKYGLTSDLTLTGTINPDFGQVEADPSVVNLSAFETFYPERRPFFLEGSSLFAFGIGDDGSGEGLFYSRRIGRSPQRSFIGGADHVDMPDAATILGAGKITGRLGQWSIGFFDAVTQMERANVLRDGITESVVVEPLTNYAVGRAGRDFRDGASTISAMFTATNRRIDDDALAFLRSSAYSAGLTARHRFGADNRYQLSGMLAGSTVSGDTLAIQQAQRAPQRYYQRPDATHVEYDPLRTSLSGLMGSASIGKVAGGKWNASMGGAFRTPGFEVNDAGFQQNADQRFIWGSFNYNDVTPRRFVRQWNVGLNPNSGWDFGGTRLWSQINTWGGVSFTNFWSLNYFANNRWAATSTGALRGGPALRVPGSNNYNLNINSDRRKSIHGGLHLNGSREQETGALRSSMSVSLAARPSARMDLSLQPSYTVARPSWQYVASTGDGTGTTHYLFAAMDQQTLSLTARLSYTFTRDLSLQLYVEPFTSAADFKDFRRVADPAAAAFNDRFHTFAADEIAFDAETARYTAQVGEGAVTFRDPDFSQHSLRSNAVLRWEYRPGSTLFVVWSQGRSQRLADGAFDFNRSIEDLRSLAATNTLMVKLNYWLNM